MKKLIYTVALVVMGFTASYAQQAKLTAEQRAAKATAVMQQKLSLTADQKAKVEAIQLEKAKKHDQWKKADKNDPKVREEQKAFAKVNQEKVNAILTADQKKTWETARKEMRGKKGGKGHRADKQDKAPTKES